MKELVKVTIALVLTALCFGAVINGIDNPKPTKLATTIAHEIRKVTQ